MAADRAPRKFLADVLLALAQIMACAVVVALVTGCGQSHQGTPASSLASSPPSDAPPWASAPSSLPKDIESVFAQLATASRPMTIFAPTFLPEGAALPEEWWPVIELADPEAYEGPMASNPQVLGSEADSEIQVIVQAGSGWLAILENFRGDLGDVTGTPVGSVAGSAASLYQINGGELIQWSQDGLWYGVFGRGISRDDLVAVALGMQAVSSESG